MLAAGDHSRQAIQRHVEIVVDDDVIELQPFGQADRHQGQPGAGAPTAEDLVLDSGPGKLPVREYMRQEARFRITETLDPERYRQLLTWAQQNVTQRYGVYEQLAKVVVPQVTAIPDVRPPPAAAVE